MAGNPLPFELRPHQTAGLEMVRKWYCDTISPRLLVAGPTGSGKSYTQLAAQHLLGGWIIAPRVEILAGLLTKLAIPYRVSNLEAVAEAHQLMTPIRLRNKLLAGGEAPTLLHIDEAHHSEADTYKQLNLLTDCRQIGSTATPFRGTPKGTADFLAYWGQPHWLISYEAACSQGIISIPKCRVVPLVDDDVVTISAGEFQVQAVSTVVMSRLQAIAELAQPMYLSGPLLWDKPTMFSFPSTETLLGFAALAYAARLPCVSVIQDTSDAERARHFDACVSRHAALLQINVVSEGIDLPISRLIDCSPTLSPVKWLQQLGRITRPGLKSEYICTNRNLIRHAYLLEGVLPPSVVADAQKAWPQGSSRLATRVLGLEAVGRFKGAELPLSDGSTGVIYQVNCADGTRVTQYAMLLHPAKATPIWAKRVFYREATTIYGKWTACKPPESLQGFASSPPDPLTQKMSDWWKRDAARWGLDPDADINKKSFAALPVLANIRRRL